MSRAKILLLSLLTVFATGAITTASATASLWLANTEETAGQEVTYSGGTFTLTAGAKKITCTALSGHGRVEGEKDLSSEIKLTGCTTSQTGCLPLTSGAPKSTVVFLNLPTLLVERENVKKEKSLADEFKANPTTKELATLLFLTLAGGSCSEYGTSTKVKGQAAAEVDNTTEELDFPTEELKGNTLEAFGVAATMAVSLKQKLVEGKLQAAQPPIAQFITFFPGQLQFSATLNEELFFTLKDRGTREVELVEQKLAGANPNNYMITDVNNCFKKRLKTDEQCKVTVKLVNVAISSAIYEGKVTYIGGLANVPVLDKSLVNA